MDEIVKLDARGQVRISSEVLEAWGVKAGDSLAVRLEAGVLRLTPRRAVISSLAGKYTRASAKPAEVVVVSAARLAVSPAPIVAGGVADGA